MQCIYLAIRYRRKHIEYGSLFEGSPLMAPRDATVELPKVVEPSWLERRTSRKEINMDTHPYSLILRRILTENIKHSSLCMAYCSRGADINATDNYGTRY